MIVDLQHLWPIDTVVIKLTASLAINWNVRNADCNPSHSRDPFNLANDSLCWS